MSNFTKPVIFLLTDFYNGGRRVHRLSHDVIWEVGFEGSENYVYIQKNYMTDLFSIPTIFEPFINTYGKYAAAGALHDKLYDVLDNNRAFADKQLYDALIVLGASKTFAFLVWATVRILGGKAFKDKKTHGITNYKEIV